MTTSFFGVAVQVVPPELIGGDRNQFVIQLLWKKEEFGTLSYTSMMYLFHSFWEARVY